MRETDADPIKSEFIRNGDKRIVGAYWTLTCAWCARSGRIDVKWYAPVSDPRHGISTLAGWEIGNRLVICPDCVEHDEWSRLWPPPSG